MDPTETQFHVLINTIPFGRLLRRLVRHRDVLELGVGTGAITRLILDAHPSSVTGFEILPGICRVVDPKLALFERDYTLMPSNAAGIAMGGLHRDGLDDVCLVAAPAYKTLPFIEDAVLPVVHDVVLMIPQTLVGHYLDNLGFERMFEMDGASFDPPAEGTHVVVIRGFEEARTFVDLEYELKQTTLTTVGGRLRELAQVVPTAAITAVGGLPITFSRSGFSLAGGPLTTESLREHLRKGLGHSGLLTFTNKRGHERTTIADICLDRGETWAYHWMNLTMLLSGSPRAQLAFARDTRFHLSWTDFHHGAVVRPRLDAEEELHTFEATGSLKAWRKFSEKDQDASFDSDTRWVMSACRDVLDRVMP